MDESSYSNASAILGPLQQVFASPAITRAGVRNCFRNLMAHKAHHDVRLAVLVGIRGGRDLRGEDETLPASSAANSGLRGTDVTCMKGSSRFTAAH